MRTRIFPNPSVAVRPFFWTVDKHFSDIIESYEKSLSLPSSSLSYELKETDQAYFMSFDVPGVSKDSLEIEVEGDHLKMSGKRSKPFFNPDKEDVEYKKTISLPPEVNTEKIHAHVEDGVLYLALPKLEKALARKITISSKDQQDWKHLLDQSN